MTERRIACFFYGLFMDAAILQEKQVIPVNPRPAVLEGFQPVIGRRATLVPRAGARVYGMLFSLTHSELARLYAGPDLEPYHPEAVLTRTLDGAPVPALCYSLPEAPPPEERNGEYAARLQDLLRRLRFPEDYVATLS